MLFKSVLIFGGFIVAGIPTWIYLLMRHVFEPVGFWQNLVLFGIGFWAFGGVQFVLLIVFFFWCIFVLGEV